MAPERLEKATSVFNLCTYLGLGIGLALVPLVEDWSMIWIGTLDALTFLVSAFFYHRFRRRRSSLLDSEGTAVGPEQQAGAATLAEAFRTITGLNLWPLLLMLALTVGVFQAYLAVGREALPLLQLGLDSVAVTHFMVAQLIGVLVGPLLVARFLQIGRAGLEQFKRPVPWFLLTGLLAALLPWSSDLWLLLAGFTLVTVVFEICFTLLTNRLVMRAPTASIAIVMLVKNTLALILMSLGLLVTGAATDGFGFPLAATGLMLVAVMALGVLLRVQTRPLFA